MKNIDTYEPSRGIVRVGVSAGIDAEQMTPDQIASSIVSTNRSRMQGMWELAYLQSAMWIKGEWAKGLVERPRRRHFMEYLNLKTGMHFTEVEVFRNIDCYLNYTIFQTPPQPEVINLLMQFPSFIKPHIVLPWVRKDGENVVQVLEVALLNPAGELRDLCEAQWPLGPGRQTAQKVDGRGSTVMKYLAEHRLNFVDSKMLIPRRDNMPVGTEHAMNIAMDEAMEKSNMNVDQVFLEMFKEYVASHFSPAEIQVMRLDWAKTMRRSGKEFHDQEFPFDATQRIRAVG